MAKESDIISIQYLRGLAALGVVFCHYGYNLAAYPRISAIFKFGRSGVDVFFLISGFIIVYSLIIKNYNPTQFFKFLLKRSIRIDPSYYAVVILTLLFWRIVYIITAFLPDRINFVPAQFIAHLLYYIPFTKYPFYNHIFWTLSIEFQFYLIIGVFYFLVDSQIYRHIFLIVFCALSLVPVPNSDNIIFTYSPIFSLGISLVYFYKQRNLMNGLLPMCLLPLIWYKFGPGILCLLLISCIVILFFKIRIKPLNSLGNISYSLYLTHYLTMAVVLIAMNHLHVVVANHQLLCLLCEVPIACAAANIFYWLIEKPSIMLSKRINYE